MRVGKPTLLTGLLAGGLLVSAGNARAQSSEAVTLHGFGGWALGNTDNDNTYGNVATNDTELNNYYFSLNLSARASEDVTLHAQANWKNDIRGDEVDMDFAFAKWAFAKGFSLRAGKIKNPVGLYTEIYDVGTLRPFYLLPQSRYDGVSKSYTGAGLTWEGFTGSWEFAADVFGGLLAIDPLRIDLPVGADPATGLPILQSVLVDSDGRDMFGARLTARPPVEGLEVGVSFCRFVPYTSIGGAPKEESPNGAANVVYLHADYTAGPWILRGETLHSRGNADFDTAYVEAAYKLTEKWQVAGTYGWADRGELAATPQLGDHDAVGVGLNFWPAPRVVFKLDYYHVTGNAFARPDNATEAAIMGALEDTTNVFIAGVQWAF
jgi:hypothetical protein